eukprot:192143_1
MSKLEARTWNIHDTNRMIASLTSGFVQSMVGFPIDCIKVAMQRTAKESATRKPPGFLGTTIRMYRESGLKAFYRGALSPSLGKMVSYCVFFVTNGYLKDLLIEFRQPEDGILSVADTCLVGTLCGVILTPVMTPSEMVKVQMQFDVFEPKRYKGMVDCARKCYKYSALWRGTLSTMSRLAPAWGVYLAVYDGFNRWFDERATLGKIDTLTSLSASGRVILGGGIAGIISWIASYPQDFVKTQIQGQAIADTHNYTRWRKTRVPRIRDVIGIYYERFGMQVFFRGLTPCLIRAFPANLTNFWVYESVLQFRERGFNGEDEDVDSLEIIDVDTDETEYQH